MCSWSVGRPAWRGRTGFSRHGGGCAAARGGLVSVRPCPVELVDVVIEPFEPSYLTGGRPWGIADLAPQALAAILAHPANRAGGRGPGLG